MAGNGGALRVVLRGGDVGAPAGVQAALEHQGAVVVDGAADVVLLVAQDGHRGVRGLRQLARDLPGVPVVLLCETSDGLLEALRAGAQGYLLVVPAHVGLVASLRGASAGELALPRHLVGQVVQALRLPAEQPHTRLTTREREVMSLLVLGLTTREVAQRLFVSPVTVRTHLMAAQRKLGATCRAGAVEEFDGLSRR